MILFEIYYHDPWRTQTTYARQYITTSVDDATQWLLEHLDEWYCDNDPEIDHVVDQRFDTRELLDKWTNVELKRDDLVCMEWAKNYYLTVDLNNTHPNTYPFEPKKN